VIFNDSFSDGYATGGFKKEKSLWEKERQLFFILEEFFGGGKRRSEK
jgi:hypothetical protein